MPSVVVTNAGRGWRRIARWALCGSLLPAAAGACGWSWETYAAEATSLPCVHDAVVGFFPKHTPAYHEAVIGAVDYALAWAPDWAAGLDAKGLAEMHLGRFDAARKTMTRRYELAKDAYAGHANLGTLYTFTGDYAASLEHIQASLTIEPKAHFGREKYHQKLVEFLRDAKADLAVATTRNFLGVTLTTVQRVNGSPAAYAKAGYQDDAIDALVSMIAVYGAEQVAEIYLTLGELLALRGAPRLAWTAYTRAIDLKHPRAEELTKWKTEVFAAFPSSQERRAPRDRRFEQHGASYALDVFYRGERDNAEHARSTYAAWETEEIAAGLPVWTEEGIHRLYAKMNEIRLRCRTPSVIDAREPLDPRAVLLEPLHKALPCPLCGWKTRAEMDGAILKPAKTKKP